MRAQPHDYHARFKDRPLNGQGVVIEFEDAPAREVDPVEVNDKLAPYDRFILSTYQRVYTQFNLDAGLIGQEIARLDVGSESQRADLMANLDKVHTTVQAVQEAKRAYSASLRQT